MRTVFALLAICVAAQSAVAEIIVNSAQLTDRRVTVQLIQTALDNGTSPATAFGTASQRASIEAGIDQIWAQAGIDISILPNIVRYSDTFAYQGNAGSGTRSGGDLSTTFTNARNEGGILSSDPLVLNLIFANIVPAFAPLSENTTAGYARVDGNGIIGFVGDNLLTYQGGRDVIAGVMAHEIGHNLGLNHTSSNQPNLMSPNGTTEQLNNSQIATARSSRYAVQIPTTLTGDFNRDGTVSVADYTVWRKTLNTTTTYNQWRHNFGGKTGGGSTASGAVPEPASALLCLVALAIFCFQGRKR